MTAIGKFYKVELVLIFMRKEILIIVLIALVGLLSFVDAGSSSITWVNFTVCTDVSICFNESNVDAFAGHVEDLEVEDKGYTWFYLTWENTNDSRFSHNLVFIDQILVGQTAGEDFNVTGLNEDTRYEISIISISDEDAEGKRVAISQRTLEEDDDSDDDDEDDDRKSGKKTGMRDDVIPNFFVSDDVILMGEVVIALESASVECDDYDWFVLLWSVLGLLIFVLLVLIFVLLRR